MVYLHVYALEGATPLLLLLPLLLWPSSFSTWCLIHSHTDTARPMMRARGPCCNPPTS
jgi:hypothetical protein